MVFRHPRFSFATPICFEDVFPNDVRLFVRAGAEVILNLSNDYWSLTEAEGMQHAANSVFRAVENGWPVARAAASGLTCLVDTCGTHRGHAQPLLPGKASSLWMSPCPSRRTTLYTRVGGLVSRRPSALRLVSLVEPVYEARTLTVRSSLYAQLFQAYGPQGWWPIPAAPAARVRRPGYHPGDYDAAADACGRFEVIMGAVLTQNTAWTNADDGARHLLRRGSIVPRTFSPFPIPPGRLIRSSGYFNQKAKKLNEIAALFSLPRSLQPSSAPARDVLLAQWGVGPETADSILLYAFQVPVFVVDAYTRRILSRIGLIDGTGATMPSRALPRVTGRAPALFNEYHALMVEHAKMHCRAGRCARRVPCGPAVIGAGPILNRRLISATLAAS